MTDAYIFDAIRTPRGKGRVRRCTTSSPWIWSQVSCARCRRATLDTAQIDDVILGCVTPVGEQRRGHRTHGRALAGWDQDTPGMRIVASAPRGWRRSTWRP
ncbi:MAG: hypothetical protein R2854_16825 [Caldilineaceae bacterium]